MLRILAFLIAFWVGPAVSADPVATDALNTCRSSKGRSAVTYSKVLVRAAQAHALDMVRHGYFDHTGRDRSTIGDRLTAQGYGFCFAAENIAKSQTSLKEVMRSWANSPGHRKKMVHRKVTEFAVARAEGNIWAMVLGTPGC